MADDNMEISSELGQNNGGDDIDIDIDFVPEEPDHVYEDHILEDIKSDIDFEETNDDLMVDDDNASVPMDDVDLASEGDIQNDLSNQEAPAEMTDAVPVGSEVRDMLGVDVTEDHLKIEATGMTWDVTKGPDALVEKIIEQVPKEPAVAEKVATKASEVPEVSKAAEIPEESEVPETTEAKEVAQEQSFIEATSETGESTTNDKETASDVVDAQSHEIPEEHEEHEAEHREQAVVDGVVSKSDVLSFTPTNVTVLYQDTDYSLISTSEADDPDSFFLKDDALTRAPLQSFLDGLREVIFDELSPDDELCLAIDDLGIEICEASASTFDLTFAQIMTLRDDLLRNDGVKLPNTLHVSLGVKPNYSMRLKGLLSGAREGKGLSQLVTWEEESEFFDDEEVECKNDSEDEANPNDNSAGTDGGVGVEQFSPNTVVEARGDEIHGASDFVEPVDPSSNGEAKRNENTDAPTTEEFREIEESEIQQVTEELDDEADLIDYGDETVQRPASATGGGQYNAEYESINEEFRRRSLSQVPANKADTNTTPPADLNANHGEPEATVLVGDLTADDRDSDADGHPPYDDDKLEEELEGDEYGKGETIVGPDNNTNISQQSVTPNPSLVQDSESTTAKQQASAQEDFDEIDYAESTAVDNAQLDAGVQEQSYLTDVETSGLDRLESNEDEIGFEETEYIPESNGSESTLIGDETKTELTIIDNPDGNDGNDEIDYDDNDRADSAKLLDANSPAGESSLSTGSNGKRSHADLDDSIAGEGRDSKRVCA